MNAYVFRASLICTACAMDVMRSAPKPVPVHWKENSDLYPQGPYMSGGGEADSPHHCDRCGLFLANPLTSDGVKNVRRMIAEDKADGRLDSVAVTMWARHYHYELQE